MVLTHFWKLSLPKKERVAEMARFTFDIDTHGEGGFAKVRKGMDKELERVVAVKVLKSKEEITPSGYIRALRC